MQTLTQPSPGVPGEGTETAKAPADGANESGQTGTGLASFAPTLFRHHVQSARKGGFTMFICGNGGHRVSFMRALVTALVLAISLLVGGSRSAVADSAAAPAGPQNIYGTVAGVDASGVISIIPWGKKAAGAKSVSTTSSPKITINLDAGKAADLKEGMWIEVQKLSDDGKAQEIIAGQFIQEDGDKVVIFKGMPEEFLVYRSEGWYTNVAGGVEYKVQPMGAGKEPSNPGTNLRAAKYQEPAGGFVVYLPLTLKGAVVNWGGSKPGANVPDAEGRVFINKDTCTESYFKHPKNPARPEAGYVSGMTEFTIRKLPKRP